MVDCVGVVRKALQEAISKYGEDLLKKGKLEIRKILITEYRLPMLCRDTQFIEQALTAEELERQKAGGRVDVLVITAPRDKGFVTPGGGMYPNYSIAEVLFIGLYQEDPVSAHERMYEILEPILLSEAKDHANLRKALFMPVNSATWYSPNASNGNSIKVMESLIQFLEVLDEDRRKDVCKALTHTFNFLPTGLEFKTDKDSIVWRLHINNKLFALCPDLTHVFKGR